MQALGSVASRLVFLVVVREAEHAASWCRSGAYFTRRHIREQNALHGSFLPSNSTYRARFGPNAVGRKPEIPVFEPNDSSHPLPAAQAAEPD